MKYLVVQFLDSESIFTCQGEAAAIVTAHHKQTFRNSRNSLPPLGCRRGEYAWRSGGGSKALIGQSYDWQRRQLDDYSDVVSCLPSSSSVFTNIFKEGSVCLLTRLPHLKCIRLVSVRSSLPCINIRVCIELTYF